MIKKGSSVWLKKGMEDPNKRQKTDEEEED